MEYNREIFGHLYLDVEESTTAAIQQHSAINNSGGFILALKPFFCEKDAKKY